MFWPVLQQTPVRYLDCKRSAQTSRYVFLLWKGLPNANFHSDHNLRISKALFIATLSCGWGGAASASEHVSALITKYKYKIIYGLIQIESAVFKRRMPYFRSIYIEAIVN